MVIEIYSQQFSWSARYAGEDNQLGFANVGLIKGANVLGVDSNDLRSGDDIIVDELHLPVGKPVLLKFRSQDVIHSAYLPHFRVKMDCVPGLPTQFMFTPTYTTAEYKEKLKNKKFWKDIDPKTGEPRWQNFKFELACAELCGKSHFGMQKNVVVVTQAEYDEWLAKQKPFYETVVKDAMSKIDNQ